MTNSIVFGSDSQRPGAGVVAAEQVVRAGAAGAAPARSAPIGRPRRCSVYAAADRPGGWHLDRAGGNQVPGGAALPPVSADAMVVGQQYFVECLYADDGRLAFFQGFTHQPGAPAAGPRADAIARQVYNEVPLAFPQPHTSPPLDAPQLVGFPVWLWLDDGSWHSFEATASVAGVSVTVVARPKSVRWSMGDGTTLSCGRGTAWSSDGDPSDRSDCSHVYRWTGRYPGEVTLVWSVSWSASTGESGSLPDASRTTGFSLDVRERQAVVSHGSP